MDVPPTNKKIKTVNSQLNKKVAGESDIKLEVYKALATDENIFNIIRGFIHDFWKDEQQPSNFDIGELGILPPKGDLSLPGNCRCIMMLEVGKMLYPT
eukprot:15366827-Ditylum_brightwellii.AAC.1